MVTTYRPGAIRSAGKLYSPLSLLTTVVAIVEPSFLRLTRTPSIRPSWADDTVPLSACADAPVDAATIAPRLTPTTSQKCLLIVFSRLDLAVLSHVWPT